MNWAYLLRCKDGSLYAGWTNNMQRRLAAHGAGRASRYTRSRLPVQLVYAQSFDTKSEAMAREAALKRMSKAEKEQLVKDTGPPAIQG